MKGDQSVKDGRKQAMPKMSVHLSHLAKRTTHQTHACGRLHTYMHVRIGRGPTPPRKRDREGSNPSRQRDWEGRKPLPTAIHSGCRF